jgi:hypothetical protein
MVGYAAKSIPNILMKPNMTLIFFTRSLPNAICDELGRQGHTIHECLAISEVLHLAEQHPTAAVVINHDVEAAAAKVIQQHYPTLVLTAGATTADALFELSHLTKGATIQ